MNKRTRNVCFTGFNENGYKFNEKQMKYLVVGKEICPTTGKEHWQGYVELKNAKTFSAIKKLFKDNKLHLEERKGNALQASNYCKKDGKYEEFGELSSQGARSDLVTLKDDILAGKKNCTEVREENPELYHQYGRTLDKLEDDYLCKQKRNWMTKGIWIWGPTGCGKSRWAYETYPDAYTWADDKDWQDCYNGQETIIIDDFRGNIKFQNLLKMIDRYEFKLSRRGRIPFPLLAKTIVITSSMPPEKVYKNLSADDSIEQLKRRCKIIELPKCTEENYTEVVRVILENSM